MARNRERDRERGREHGQENDTPVSGVQTDIEGGTSGQVETAPSSDVGAGPRPDGDSGAALAADPPTPIPENVGSSENGAAKKTYLNTVTGEVKSPEELTDDEKLGKDGEYVTLENVTVLKKIVAKSIVGRRGLSMKRSFQKDEAHKDGGYWKGDDPKALYTVMGTCIGYKAGNSDFGPFLDFDGTFEAVRIDDGARFASTRCFLQNPADKLLFDALMSAKDKDANASVTFAFDIGIQISDKYLLTGEGSSYEYTITSRINVKKHDPLAQLRAAVYKRLPAPKSAA